MPFAECQKRKANASLDMEGKHYRHKKPYYSNQVIRATNGLEIGMAGIFVTCPRRKERQCASEMLELLNENVANLHPELKPSRRLNNNEPDIEASIEGELSSIKHQNKGLIRFIQLDTDCVIFLQTLAPLDPVKLVESLCKDMQSTEDKFTKWPQRVIPITASTSSNIESLRVLSTQVLAPHFHAEGCEKHKFAIRPTFRNHSRMNRDDVIRTVASIVGHDHSVDLHNYDLLIVVETFKHFTGMSVVRDFEQFKRFNMSQICQGKHSKSEAL